MDLILKNVKKKDLSVLKSLVKALGFEIDENEKKYDPEFVSEILKASEDIKNGKGRKIEPQNLDEFLGL